MKILPVLTMFAVCMIRAEIPISTEYAQHWAIVADDGVAVDRGETAIVTHYSGYSVIEYDVEPVSCPESDTMKECLERQPDGVHRVVKSPFMVVVRRKGS